MTQGLVRCGTCGMEMVRRYEDGKVKLRAAILVWDDEGCIGKCRKCGNDVRLQLPIPFGVPPRVKKRPIHVVISR